MIVKNCFYYIATLMISSYFLWNINEQYQKLRKTSCCYDCNHHWISRCDSDKVLHLRAHGIDCTSLSFFAGVSTAFVNGKMVGNYSHGNHVTKTGPMLSLVDWPDIMWVGNISKFPCNHIIIMLFLQIRQAMVHYKPWYCFINNSVMSFLWCQ